MKPFLSTMTPEPRLRSASGLLSGASKKRSKKSWKGSPNFFGVLPPLGFSITCVVEMLTTAGPSFLEMAEKALESVMGSGTARSVAPAAVWSCVACACPEISVPMTMPMPRVQTTRRVAKILRRRIQLNNSRNSMPIPVLLVRYESLTARMAENKTAWKAPKVEYTTRFNPATGREFRDVDGGNGEGWGVDRIYAGQ